MESVIMTSPSSSSPPQSTSSSAGSENVSGRSRGARLKSRLQNAALNFFSGSRSGNNGRSCCSTAAPVKINNKSTSTTKTNNNNFFHRKNNQKSATTTTNNNYFQQHQNCKDSAAMIFNGNFTGQVYEVVRGRLGSTNNIPEGSVQMLFNDMNLHPSKSQVNEMLSCARQCAKRNGSRFLTLGEFCLFASELKKPINQQQRYSSSRQTRNNTKLTSENCQVFLGGSCNPTTWRTDVAIPELQKYGITYYNPQKPFWSPELVSEEHDAKQSASVLLYVVESQTRNVVGMMEVAYLMASDRCVVLVIYPYKSGQCIMGEKLSNREYVDLVEGQITLIALVKSQGVMVHENLPSALKYTAEILRNSSEHGTTAEDILCAKLKRMRELFDTYDNNNREELTINDAIDAFHRLTNRTLIASDLYKYLNLTADNSTNFRISFEHFCAIVAEFNSANDWTQHPVLKRECKVDRVERKLTNNYIVDVYLGGSFNTKLQWREEMAIPLLKKHSLTYHAKNDLNRTLVVNNDVASLSESDVLERVRVMNRSKIILFVITNDTKSLSSMILAAHFVGLCRNNIVLCIQQLPQNDCKIGIETVTEQAVKDYNRGRVYLRDFAKRKQVPVFEDITEAVQFVVDKCRLDRR